MSQENSKKTEEHNNKDNIQKYSLTRRQSLYDYDQIESHQLQIPYSSSVKNGLDILRHPSYNKGLAFTWKERKAYHLHGLLPATYFSLQTQAKQVMVNVRRIKDPLEKYIFFMSILETNEKLFYCVLINNLAEMMPIVYTPTVGLACEKFGYIFQRPRGMYITIRDHHRVYQMLKHWPINDVRAICVTDGERILGLGDLGAFGMGIPIGKLALYTSCGGIKPHQLLPVMLDVGTNRKEYREDEFYIGLRQERAVGKEYDSLLEEFMRAVTERWGPTTLIQFEDFGNSNAFRLLSTFKDRYCTFNDDIQGTAAVALAGILTSLRVKGAISQLKDHVILMYGAGSAGVGIAEYISMEIAKTNHQTIEEARKRIWLTDSKGLVFKGRQSGGIDSQKQLYAHEWKGGEIQDLEKIVKAIKATALLGVLGQGKTFTENICKAVLSNNARPIIFPMSNPTSKSECTAEEAYKWTNNQCIFASGSPFETLKIGNKSIVPAQGNNSYIFPGMALGIISCRSSRVTDEMFIIAAKTLSNLVTDDLLAQGTIYPLIEQIRDVSFEIAVAICTHCFKVGLANVVEPQDIRKLVKQAQYDETLYSNYVDTAFDSLEQDFQH